MATSLGLVTNFWLSAVGLLFAAYFTQTRLPIRDAVILLIPLIATVSYFLLPAEVFVWVNKAVVVPFSLVVVVAIFVVLIRDVMRHPLSDSTVILVSICAAVVLAVRDSLVIANLSPDHDFLHFRIAYIVILPGLSLVFIKRFLRSFEQVDHLLKTMDSTIEHKEREYRETYRQRELLEERQRIIRDVHDGLGGQLMSIIALAANKGESFKPVEDSARTALEDLRMVINSLAVDQDITGVLGTFRERAEIQLTAHGIALERRMVDIPPIKNLSPTHALNVLRVMQEAITNVIEHSGADKVIFDFVLGTEQSRFLRIDISDNGRGLTAPEGNEGYGLKNMRSRAEQIGGDLEVTSTPNHTRVGLTIPIP
ncbi:MAG: hypothetical protein NXH97_00095 [Rhodobacteraceae bacterium]|nr:hypothetical protein [Paracoccaceae bacterium]